MARLTYEAFGEAKTLFAWSKDARCVVSHPGLRKRLADGWPLERALTEPVATKGMSSGKKLVTAFGETKSLLAWERDPRCLVTRRALKERLEKGVEPEEAMGQAPSHVPDFSPLEAFGETKALMDWSRDPRCQVTYQQLRHRLKVMTLEEALKAPARGTVLHEAFGEAKTLAEWVADPRCQVKRQVLDGRLQRGLPLEEALTSIRGRSHAHEAFGERKSLTGWARDPRSKVPVPATLHFRVKEMGVPLEEALTTECLRPSSGFERPIEELLRSWGLEVHAHDRTAISPMEIDLLLPALSLGIECNGVHWHREAEKGRDYHRTKWERCMSAGMRLLQIWEDDYLLRRPVVERMLRHKVGLAGEKVGGRSTVVTTVPWYMARRFMDANHIQGAVPATLHLGLVHGEALVAVCSFRREPASWTLARYATSMAVQGGFSKVLQAFIRTERPQKIVTFADHCVSDGDLYERTGFVNDGELAPDYTYLVRGRRVHKFNYRLARFERDPDLLYHPDLTERELADLNGLDRIYDAGKTRYVWTP